MFNKKKLKIAGKHFPNIFLPVHEKNSRSAPLNSKAVENTGDHLKRVGASPWSRPSNSGRSQNHEASMVPNRCDMLNEWNTEEDGMIMLWMLHQIYEMLKLVA
jgi:hypothetical protein